MNLIAFSIDIFLAPRVNRAFRLLKYSDGLGAAMFSVLAEEKTLLLDLSEPVAVLMGMITGISGGTLRDIITARMPLLFGREHYATPLISGCTFIVCSTAVPVPMNSYK